MCSCHLAFFQGLGLVQGGPLLRGFTVLLLLLYGCAFSMIIALFYPGYGLIKHLWPGSWAANARKISESNACRITVNILENAKPYNNNVSKSNMCHQLIICLLELLVRHICDITVILLSYSLLKGQNMG